MKIRKFSIKVLISRLLEKQKKENIQKKNLISYEYFIKMKAKKRREMKKESLLGPKTKLKPFYRILTREMRRSKRRYLRNKRKSNFDLIKPELENRLFNLNKIETPTLVRRNVSYFSFFRKILRRSIRRRLRLKREKFFLPKISVKNSFDFRFLKIAHRKLIETKKYLYRKKFPKIKGRKNKNFNFVFYNALDKTSLRFFLGRLVITYLHNNTFMNLHDNKKMLKVFSAGKIGFKGPKRSTPLSRQIVAKRMAAFLSKSNINILDVYLNSNYNRWYYFLFKEFSKVKVRDYVVRYLVPNNCRPHGFVRDKKHRRK